jgi:hypothetical protein
VKPVLDAPSSFARATVDDDIGDAVDLNHNEGLDADLSAEVELILTKCPRSLRSPGNIAQMLSEACTNVSPLACLKVIETYASNGFELRHRVEEISLHLSRLSASNTRKLRGLTEIDDLLFGPCFDERGTSSPPLKGAGGSTWSNVDGLEPFRRILVDDYDGGDAENANKADDQEFGKRIPLSSKIGIALRSL